MRKCLPVLFIVLLTACGTDTDERMSQREMRKFLTDLHLLEGIIMNDPELSNDERIEVYYYNALFAKHGISKAVFDSSLVFYTKQPKRFERIYAGVIRGLEKLQEEVVAGKYEKVLPDSIRLQTFQYELPISLDTLYAFTPDSPRTKLSFSIKNVPLMTRDLYHLKFRLRREPADSSVGGYAALRIHYADGKVDTLSYPTKNDSILRRYHFRFKAIRNFQVDSLSGELLGTKKVKGKFRVYLDSISLQREYIPFLQDTLRNNLDTIPVSTIPADTIDLSAGSAVKTSQSKSQQPTSPAKSPDPRQTIQQPGPGNIRPENRKEAVMKSEGDDR